MERVDLPRKLAIELLDAAQRSPGHEVCGLVAARGRQPVRVIPIRNAAADPRRFFEMDERELVAAMKAMRENGEVLFGIYHSHPDAAPELSAIDIERAGYPDVLHLVVSMQVKGVLQMHGWKLDNGTARAVQVHVHED